MRGLMQLSQQESRNVAIMGLGAMATAILYQLGVTYIRQSTDSYPLSPETEALQMYSTLYSLMYQLSNFRSQHETAYRQAVVEADCLAVLALSMNSQKISPSVEDAAEAMASMGIVSKQITRMQTAAKKMHNTRAAATIYSLNCKIYTETQSLYTNILRHVRRAST